jgi:hypothetical protein
MLISEFNPSNPCSILLGGIIQPEYSSRFSPPELIPSIGGELIMKKQPVKKTSNLTGRFPLFISNRKEREALTVAVQMADEQSEKLGLLDPTETEPALLYSPAGGEK